RSTPPHPSRRSPSAAPRATAGRSGRSSCRGLLYHGPDPGDEPAMLELLGVARLPAVDDDLVLPVVLERPDLLDLVPFGAHDVGPGVPEVHAEPAPTVAPPE